MAWRSFKICKDCKYYRKLTEHTKRAVTVHHDCVYYPDLVTGAPLPIPAQYMRGTQVRDGKEACGPNGQFWERADDASA